MIDANTAYAELKKNLLILVKTHKAKHLGRESDDINIIKAHFYNIEKKINYIENQTVDTSDQYAILAGYLLETQSELTKKYGDQNKDSSILADRDLPPHFLSTLIKSLEDQRRSNLSAFQNFRDADNEKIFMARTQAQILAAEDAEFIDAYEQFKIYLKNFDSKAETFLRSLQDATEISVNYIYSEKKKKAAYHAGKQAIFTYMLTAVNEFLLAKPSVKNRFTNYENAIHHITAAVDNYNSETKVDTTGFFNFVFLLTCIILVASALILPIILYIPFSLAMITLAATILFTTGKEENYKKNHNQLDKGLSSMSLFAKAMYDEAPANELQHPSNATMFNCTLSS